MRVVPGEGNCSDPGLKSERCAVKESLGKPGRAFLKGGLIRVGGDGGKVVAMTLGSLISDEVFDACGKHFPIMGRLTP